TRLRLVTGPTPHRGEHGLQLQKESCTTPLSRAWTSSALSSRASRHLHPHPLRIFSLCRRLPSRPWTICFPSSRPSPTSWRVCRHPPRPPPEISSPSRPSHPFR